MHYLVTGGAGFIGSHLCDTLLHAGHQVTALDDLSTGKAENLPAAVRLVKGDITTPVIFDDLVRSADGVFHLAAIASVQRSKEEWLRTHQVNLGGTIALFDAIVKAQKRIPVVYASSAAIYGDCPDIPLAEISRPTPISAYGADKYACELHARAASDIHHIPTAGMRFFNVYGPRQDPHSPYSGVISIFAARMKQQHDIMIHGDGGQSRDFIYVADVVRAVMLAMQSLQNKTIHREVFNICTGHSTTVKQLADLLLAATGSRSIINHDEARAGDIRTSLGNPTLAATKIGFTAQTLLTDGLKQTVDSL